MEEKREQPDNKPKKKSKFISVYRISLVKDRQVKFQQNHLNNSTEAHLIAQRLIKTHGQSDREQLCVILLNAHNDIIGLNIVSTGDLSYTVATPREVLKPAILANAFGIIICHNHPSENLNPSPEDIAMTRRMIQAAKIMGIQVHEHLIISMEKDDYYSFADNEIIRQIYKEIRSNTDFSALAMN